MATGPLLEFRREGIYCGLGDFHIDPRWPVKCAVITHGHADHARGGHGCYLAHHLTVPVLKLRLGGGVLAQGVEYGERLRLGSVVVSLHPAGHIPGSAQVRVEHGGQVWVVTGDYKMGADGLSVPWEPVECDVFVTESTFGLPVYGWPAVADVMAEIQEWWLANSRQGRPSVLLAYSLGKAQRLLSLLDGSGEVFVHPAIDAVNGALAGAGLNLPKFPVWGGSSRGRMSGTLVLLPPAAFKERGHGILRSASVGKASGWMAVRGNRRRLGVDRGFVLSDHADWEGLTSAVRASGAERVYVTHGQVEVFVRWLREQGVDARAVERGYSAGDGRGQVAQ